MLITSKIYQNIIGSHDDWSYVPITGDVKARLNYLLNKDEIQKIFHESTRAYEALKRWDLFRHFRDRIPTKIKPVRNQLYCLPCQLDGSDWRIMINHQGAWPKFWDYCCAHACHWMSVPWLVVAQHLFPEHEWQVISHSSHTGIVCLEQKLIFDPYFYLVNVPVDETMNLWFSFENEEDYYDLSELFDENNEYTYENIDGTSHHAKRFWKLADSWTGSEIELIKTLNSFLDSYNGDDNPESECFFGLTDNDHLNQDPEALLVLASRAEQY